MKDMEYEFLLRRVYKCGRDYSTGADADIYREMDSAYLDLIIKSLYQFKQDKQYQFRRAFANVRDYVREAIGAGLTQVKSVASESDINELEEMKNTLVTAFTTESDSTRLFLEQTKFLLIAD